jgi:type IV pilus assembly protein PilE
MYDIVEQKGFTLIEIMVAVVIVAILASFAYPSYLESVRKAKRAEARAALMQLMQQQERYYSQNNRYIAFSSESAGENEKKFSWYSGSTPSTSAYEIEGRACENGIIENCVALTARPGTAKVDRNYSDTRCGELTLTSTGAKSATGSAADCWR